MDRPQGPHLCSFSLRDSGQFPWSRGGQGPREDPAGKIVAGLDWGDWGWGWGQRGCCSRHPEPLPARVTRSPRDYGGGIREVCSFLPPSPLSLSLLLSLPSPSCPHSLSLFLSYPLDQDSQAAFKPKPRQDHEPLRFKAQT